MAEEMIIRISGLYGGSDETDENKEKAKPKSSSSILNKAMHPWASFKGYLNDPDIKRVNEEGELVPNVVANNALKMAAVIVDSLEQVSKNSVNRYYKLSEDYVTQNFMANVGTNINRVQQIASKLGKGDVFGAVGSVASMYLQYDQKMFDYNNRMNATNMNTDYNQRRRGLYTGGKETLN